MCDKTSTDYVELSDVPEDEETSEMSDECTEPEPEPEPEPEGLTFYHMDLYESRDRLGIFPDDQFMKMRRDGDLTDISESEGTGVNEALGAEQAEHDLQKELEELARLYGIEEDKEIENDFLGYSAYTKKEVSSGQPSVQENDVEVEKWTIQVKAQDKQDECVDQFIKKTSEDTHSEEPSNEKPGNENLCDEQPSKEDANNEKTISEGPFKEEFCLDCPYSEEPCREESCNKEPYGEEHCIEELHNEELGNEEPHKDELCIVESRIKESCDEEHHSEEACSEEPQNAEPHSTEACDEVTCSDEPPKEEPNNVPSSEEPRSEPHSEEPPGESRIEEACGEEPHSDPLSEESLNVESCGKEACTEEPRSTETGIDELHNEEPNNNVTISSNVPMEEDTGEEPLNFATNEKEDQMAIDNQNIEDHENWQMEEEVDHETEEVEHKAEEEVPDIYCVTCKTPIRAFEKLFGSHKEHEVSPLPSAVEDVKDEIHKNMCRLEEQIAQMENFASHLEEIFITVEENFGRQEQNFEMNYTEIMQTLAQRYDEKAQALEEEKKLKLEALYGQLVDCGKTLDTSKDLMETIQALFKSKDKVAFIKTAVETTDRLEEFLKADMNFQIVTYPDYENKTIDFSEVQQLLNSINTLPAPSAPVINPQIHNSATGTSVKVCWSLFSDDTVESYQLYYKPVSDDTPSEAQDEFVMNVKETYCTVENLVPNTQYEFWVTALNTTGIGPASERAVYVTAPSPPLIKYKQCRSCENAALVCWESGENVNPVDSYTVELCNLTNEEPGDCITESIVGIPTCESLIQLQPRETYDIYVRASNVGGSSQRSLPVTIHTTGTFFHLNETTAHPLLSILDDGLTISCEEEESFGDLPYHYNSFTRCIAVMGNLIPVRGRHYWEVEVEESTEYRVGVAFEDTNRNGYIGANNTSWCMRHVVTPSRHKYEFLHCGTTPDVRITIPPHRIGILLDYDNCKLSFFNMEPFQHLYTFDSHFQHLVHPCFALEKPGVLRTRNGIAIPKGVLKS
ncbi:fibronectin type III and SPRY domain-containing protein 2 [Pleurodeles waltl]|uniref:fibronectin type III and SPRY domain-containing protein 2 n=1 Tax=Pleurodeles waltl TaxID=8319 RepID=UPI00370991BD